MQKFIIIVIIINNKDKHIIYLKKLKYKENLNFFLNFLRVNCVYSLVSFKSFISLNIYLYIYDLLYEYNIYSIKK